MLRVSRRTPKRRDAVIQKSTPTDEAALLAWLTEYWQAIQARILTGEFVASLNAPTLDDALTVATAVDQGRADSLVPLLARVASQTGLKGFQDFVTRFPSAMAPGAYTTEDAASGGLLRAQFNIVDQNVVSWARVASSDLIVQIDNELRETIRGQVARSAGGEWTAQQLAQQIARVVPLHTRYQNAVTRTFAQNYRTALKAGDSTEVAYAKASRVADRYAKYLTRARGRVIARTELMYASNNGTYLGQLAAMGSGMVDQNVNKAWETAEDEDVCPICGPLDQKQVAFTEGWEGVGLLPPAHPNCRCTYSLVYPEVNVNALTDYAQEALSA